MGMQDTWLGQHTLGRRSLYFDHGVLRGIPEQASEMLVYSNIISSEYLPLRDRVSKYSQ